MHTVKKPALEGINDREIAISPDDALELQLFELEQNILLQAQTLANNLVSNKHCFSFKEKQCLERNIG